jgi:hypothetical protein
MVYSKSLVEAQPEKLRTPDKTMARTAKRIQSSSNAKTMFAYQLHRPQDEADFMGFAGNTQLGYCLLAG